MHTINLIAGALDPREAPPPQPTHEGICCITGAYTTCLQRKELIGKSWNSHDRLAAPNSDLVGTNAYQVLKYRPERASSWFCDGKTFDRLNRVQVRERVLAREMPERWAGYATTSYKKHGSLIAPVNTGDRRVWLFEMLLVDLTNMGRTREIWDGLNFALRAGIGRSVLESLDCPAFLIPKIGLRFWLDFQRWARPIYQGAQYKFLCYLLPSQAELKEEGECPPK